MRFGSYVIEGPAKFLIIGATATALFFGARQFRQPAVEPQVKEPAVTTPVRTPLSIDEFWNTLTPKDQAYLVKMGYNSLSDSERQKICGTLLDDAIDQQCEVVYTGMKSGFNYLRKRVSGGLHRYNQEYQNENFRQLTDFFSPEVKNETISNSSRWFNFSR